VFRPEHFLAKIVWEKRFTRSNNAKLFSTLTENIIAYRKTGSVALLREPRSEKADSTYSNPDSDPRGLWTSVSYVNPASKKDRPNLVYPLRNPVTGQDVVHPTNAWKYEKAVYEQHVAENRLYWGSDGGHTYPRLKKFLSEMEGMVPVELWKHGETGTTDSASKLLEGEFGAKVFEFPKPPSLMRRIVALAGFGSTDGLFVDFFAGTAPTGHAVINLNREDGGRRKFILVEMAQYFDTVLLPRIKKVTFSPEWKDGKPKRMATAEEAERSPRIVKVIRLESYEDALNNIAFDDASGQQAMQFEDYLLQYMLQWETRHSETLLNVEKLARPFSYKLHIHRDGETRVQSVDLPETFAYLIGLYVQKRQVVNDNDRSYLVYRGATRVGRKVAVIWREMEGWTKDDYKRDKEFVAAQKLTAGMDEVYVNGDSYIPGARALEKLFKERMFAPVEV
jgi:adenine-specific DNA-methyltransferase